MIDNYKLCFQSVRDQIRNLHLCFFGSRRSTDIRGRSLSQSFLVDNCRTVCIWVSPYTWCFLIVSSCNSSSCKLNVTTRRAGGESLAVAQNSYAVVWFKGKELNMVFGFQLSVARAGSTINFLIMERLYRYISRYYSGYQCLGIALLIGKKDDTICSLERGFESHYKN